MKYVVTMSDRRYEVEVERISALHMLTHEEIASGISTSVQPVAVPAPKAAALTPAAVVPVPAPEAATTPTPAVALAAKAAPSGTSVISPMPGSVLGVRVNVGDGISVGQTVFVLEAVKMENEIVTPVDGTITSINVKTGDTVDTDQVMGTLS